MGRARSAAVRIKITCFNELPLPMVNMSSGKSVLRRSRNFLQRNSPFYRAQPKPRAALVHLAAEA
jgi:hypothetical protein